MPNLAQRLLAASLIALASLVGFSAHAVDDTPHPKDNKKCEPNPLFSRFKGEYLGECEHSRFSAVDLWRNKDLNNPKSGIEKFSVEGEYWYYSNNIQKDPSGLPAGKVEVRRNFENAVNAAKGRILYIDEGGNKVYFTMRRPDGEYWGVVGCGGTSGQVCNATIHRIVKVASMEQSVVVSAEQIAKSMGDEGKVVFYGIYFDTDKATLKQESNPTLAEMAKWLNSNANGKVFIVGHTDMQGPLERNMKLSQERAASVISALSKGHGIKADRLTADGVGPLAPVASNLNEAGRAKNRRVEMVLR